MSRIFITGMGAVSACGIGAETLWQAASHGKSGIGEIKLDRLPKQRISTAGAISPTSWDYASTYSDIRFQDPVTAIALAAADEAITMSGLSPELLTQSTGVVVGSGLGGAATIDTNYTRFSDDNTARLDGMAVPKLMANASASWISMKHGITGPVYCLSTACSSATQSIGLALHLMRHGVIERCLAGGTEACLVPGGFRAWELLRVMSPTKCRPFSKDRDGMLLGEGAGVFVLETEESMLSRGAEPIVELAGYGTSSDAGDLLRPDADSAARCMSLTLQDAGLASAEIGYINAHGTGTVANDVIEIEAIRQVFGEELSNVLVSSTKPIHGHALGATGALELIISVCALRDQIAPPTINFNEVDPKINLDPVANTSKPFSAKAAMSNSLAFGGINASLVVALPN